ncbi:hypothetical protein CC78DRAFT_587499 [Lojkania enalia]|uniref:WD40 repeat-like protein n=1 Tax=Lojkania enalia TaxID=147567 RepID=A0A9P4K275_9PLEO|nr:hypothetical protein CC78DRAFT_587499 [Didymosphaeria enalia]
MYFNDLFIILLSTSSALGATLPKYGSGSNVLPKRTNQQNDPSWERGYRAELETRGYPADIAARGLPSTSCIISMASCLAGYGLLSFKYQETFIKSVYIEPWEIFNLVDLFSYAGGISDTVLILNLSVAVSCATNGAIMVWDTLSFQKSSILSGDNELLASYDGKVLLWDLTTDSCLHIQRGHTRFIHTIGPNKDDTLLVTGASRGDVRV